MHDIVSITASLLPDLACGIERVTSSYFKMRQGSVKNPYGLVKEALRPAPHRPLGGGRALRERELIPTAVRAVRRIDGFRAPQQFGHQSRF